MKTIFAVAVLSLLLAMPLGLSLTPNDVSSIVSIQITKDDIIKKNVNIPLTEIECSPEKKIVFHEVKGSKTVLFLSGDEEKTYSDVSAKQILEKIKELTGADSNQLKRAFQLLVSGSLLETRNWYVYEDKFRVIEGNILSKNSPRLPNVNPPELIGKFKLELPLGSEHKFDSKACPQLVDPIPFDNLPDGQKYASSSDPQNEKLLSTSLLNGEQLTYFSNWDLKKSEEDINSLYFSIDSNSSLFVKALADDPELTQKQEALNFLSEYGNVSSEDIYSIVSETNETKTSASVAIINGKGFGFVYTAPASKFDIYKDMVDFVESSTGTTTIQISEGPQLTLDVLNQKCANSVYSINFKLEANHKNDISDLEYRIFLDSKKEDSKKIQVNDKKYSSEEIYSFDFSGQKELEIFTIASIGNNSASYEKEGLAIDKKLCDEEKDTEPIAQPQPTPQQDNNTLIFASVIAFLIGLGLMALIRR